MIYLICPDVVQQSPWYSPVECAAAFALPLGVVGLSIVILLGEQACRQHAPRSAEHVHRGSVHDVVDLREQASNNDQYIYIYTYI